MAYLIKAGEEHPTPVTPANGKAFTLEELQKFVGGFIEPLRLNSGAIIWMNEDGKLKRLPVNQVATYIALGHSNIRTTDYVVGDVVLAAPDESGEGPDADA